MIEVYGNFWKQDEYDLYCITTNGVVKKNGRCVMGRGIAQQARDRFIDFDYELGQHILTEGNVVNLIGKWDDDWYASFPVKHKWFEQADLELIEKSAKELVRLTAACHFEHVLLPRPGCGNGGLDWADVKPVIEPILDDRFTIIERKP